MLDKFKKLFGPNKTSTDVGDIGLTYARESIVSKDKTSRMACLRRRVFGSIAFVLILCAVLPWVFEPTEDFSQGGAQSEIPQAKKAPYSQRMPVVVKKASKAETSVRAEEVARNLSQTNPVPVAQKKETKIEEKRPSPRVDSKKIGLTNKTNATSQRGVEKTKNDVKKTQIATKATKASSGPKASGAFYYIQVVATSNRVSATEKAARIRKLGLPVYIEKTQRHQADIWRVRVGRFDTLKKANVALDKLALNSVTNGGIMTEKTTKK